MTSLFFRLAFLTSLLVGAPRLYPPDGIWQPAPNQQGVYLFQGADWRCTAWAVSELRLLTAAHCIPDHVPASSLVGLVKSPKGWVPAYFQSIGRADYVHDWAIIKLKAPADLDPLELRLEVPDVHEELFAAGYAGYDVLTRRRGVSALYPRIADDAFVVFLDYAARPGDSGGPILDGRGRAVALVFAGSDELEITLAVPASILAAELAACPEEAVSCHTTVPGPHTPQNALR